VVGFHSVRIGKMKMTSTHISVFPPNAYAPGSYALLHVPKPAIRPASASHHRKYGGGYRATGAFRRAGPQKQNQFVFAGGDEFQHIRTDTLNGCQIQLPGRIIDVLDAFEV